MKKLRNYEQFTRKVKLDTIINIQPHTQSILRKTDFHKIIPYTNTANISKEITTKLDALDTYLSYQPILNNE
jgi:hypothetical protein